MKVQTLLGSCKCGACACAAFISPPANLDIINHHVPHSKVVFGSDPVAPIIHSPNSYISSLAVKDLKKFDVALAGALSGEISSVYVLF